MNAADDGQDPARAEHLVVLFHGLWGNPVHLAHLRETILKAHGDKGVYVLLPKSNKDSFTYDGIEVGAERIMHEIENVISDIRAVQEAEGKEVKLSKISMAGYSLGGLVARYTVGLLYKNGVLDTLQPINFTTFATPHLGVRTPRTGSRAQIWNFLGSRTLSTSGQQMFLVDDFRGTGRPLLAVLADEKSIFVKGLSMFRRKSVYANTINDRSVPYYTSGITSVDPFVDMDTVDVHPLPDQDLPVVLDPENPVSPRKPPSAEEKQVALSWRARYLISDKTRESLPFYAFLCTALPLAVPLFLVNAGYQTFKSAQRVRLHESGSAIDLKRYRIPLLEDAQGLQDRLMERVAGERTHLNEEGAEGYLPTPPPEQQQPSPASSSTKLVRPSSEKKDSPWPTLALTDEQFQMIENLDAYVGFTKYPVHIQKVRHTHAAIVVRMEKDSFVEGKCVSGHWAANFET